MEQNSEPYRPSLSLLSLYELATLVRTPTGAQPEHNIARRWGLDENDLHVKEIETRLNRAWRGWPSNQRERLLLTAEDVALAEQLKQAWNPNENRERYTRISESAIASTQLAEKLALIFPPPWDGERARVGHLINELSNFAGGAFYATVRPDVHEAIMDAKVRLIVARSNASDSSNLPPPWELIRDLVWLVSKKLVQPSERTIRRYLDEDAKPFNTPAFQFWRRNWGLIKRVVHGFSRARAGDFERAAKAYLNPS